MQLTKEEKKMIKDTSKQLSLKLTEVLTGAVEQVLSGKDIPNDQRQQIIMATLGTVTNIMSDFSKAYLKYIHTEADNIKVKINESTK